MRFIIVAAALLFSSVSFSADYTWNPPSNMHLGSFTTASAACDAIVAQSKATTFPNAVYEKLVFAADNIRAFCTFFNYGVDNYNRSTIQIDRLGNTCTSPSVYDALTRSCIPPAPCMGESIRDSDGMCVLTCPAGSSPNQDTMVCNSLCPTGKFWDFDSESCKFPEDENCPTGSNWNPDSHDCVCDGDGVLSNTMGFRICMAPADTGCTAESPDFVGMVNGTKPYCNGRARCPSGTRLGAVGKGDASEWVCLPDQGTDESCPGGSSGNFNGQQVCIPKPNEDPDCPGGQSGMVNGVKQCIPKPGDPGSCKAGETPGFAGSGSSMAPVCVPSNYKPDTCPPGQYTWNTSSGGFACVKLPNQPKDPIRDDPNTPEDESKIAYQAKATSVTKDADGNVKETSEIEIKFPEEGIEVKGLLEDQPGSDYFKETDEFGDAELDKLDDLHKEFLSEVTSGDGSFTERVKLDQASNLIGDLFGPGGSGCTGQLVLGAYKGHQFAASCEKLGKMKALFSWFIYITTVMGIYNVLMRPPVS